MIIGTIDSIDNEKGLQIIIDGEEIPTTKKYTYLSSYVPKADDRVLIEEVGGSYVILGTIISEFDNSGIVRQADNATNAVHAGTAGEATNAQTANVAGSAGYANDAGSAETAQNANYANTAGSLSNPSTRYGQLVNNVTYQYVPDLGMSIVTGIDLSYSGNFINV